MLLPVILQIVVLGLSAEAQFIENWKLQSSTFFSTYGSHGTATSGVSDTQAIDGKALRITLNPNPPSGVGGAPAAETFARYGYGTYQARVKTANCTAQPKAGVVSGVFTYFNNGGDRNGNGLPDNSEIDFEWLCARPEIIHLSIWTDYLEAEPPQLRVVYRSINIRTGVILMECYREAFGECRPLTSAEKQPTQITPIPNYDSSTQYYDYRIILEANRLRLQMITSDGTVHTWWDYKGPSARIPKDPMYFMHNVWHSNGWYPIDDNGTMIESPRTPVNFFVDSSSFTPIQKAG